MAGRWAREKILKRHKGRPHALKGNNSFTTEADSTCPTFENSSASGHATPTTFFPSLQRRIMFYPTWRAFRRTGADLHANFTLDPVPLFLFLPENDE